MSAKLIAACIQTNTTADPAENIARIEPMIREAKERGAKFIALPENTNFMIKGRDRIFAAAKPEDQDIVLAALKNIAKETGTWILVGSLAIAVGEDKLANRSYLLTPEGKVAAHYDKIHLFDVTLSEKEFYRESDNIRPGDKAVTAPMPWGELGLTVCYDLRFPQLYRALAKSGADIITIPAAFTATTGKMHWHVLVRARAIETGCFVLAPAQCGHHDANRETYGHSLIVAPDGKILAEGSADQPEIIMAELDLAEVAALRRAIPSLQHDRNFTLSR